MTGTDAFVTWADFVRLPECPDSYARYELHDGEVVERAFARPLHIKLQKRIEQLLEAQAANRGVVATEFPYRPLRNLQYWIADVAYVPQSDWDALPPNEYPVYAPPLMVEVLSPSNTMAKLNRQMIVALSAGAQEFWVVDPNDRTVRVTALNGSQVYGPGDAIPVAMFRTTISVDSIFAV